MEVVIVQNENLERILKFLDKFEMEFKNLKRENLKPIYNTKELTVLFKVSSRCIQNWRDQGAIGFSQIKGTILYTAEDIAEFLKKHHKNTFK